MELNPDRFFEIKLRGELSSPKVVIMWRRGKTEEQRALSFDVPKQFSDEIFEHIILSYGG